MITRQDALVKIGRNIKAAREAGGMSQQDLAAGCNFEKSNMSRIEAGRSNLTVGTLLKISDVLGIRPADLLAGV